MTSLEFEGHPAKGIDRPGCGFYGRRQEPGDSLAVVSVSGGKDSTATALLALDRRGLRSCRFVMADTGHEHELTMAYALEYLPRVLGRPVEVVRADFTREIAGKRRFIESKWREHGVPETRVQRALSVLQPTGVPFLDLCLWKGRFPSRKAQFCTQMLKRIPLDTYLLDRMAEGYEVSNWRGIRRDESQNRKDASDRELTAEGFWIEHPIAAWTAQRVVDFLLERGVKLNPLYTQGMGRVGCMPCINCCKDELLEISKRFPEHVARVREWEGLVSEAAKHGWTTFFTDSAGEEETYAELHARMRIDERIAWAKTARGGRQMDFIRLAPPAQCSSKYGLCE